MFETTIETTNLIVPAPFGYYTTFDQPERGAPKTEERLLTVRINVEGKEVKLICAIDECDPLSHGYIAIDPIAEAVALDVNTVVTHLNDTAVYVRPLYPVEVRRAGKIVSYHFMRIIDENLTTILTGLGKGDTPEAQIGDITYLIVGYLDMKSKIRIQKDKIEQYESLAKRIDVSTALDRENRILNALEKKLASL